MYIECTYICTHVHVEEVVVIQSKKRANTVEKELERGRRKRTAENGKLETKNRKLVQHKNKNVQ